MPQMRKMKGFLICTMIGFIQLITNSLKNGGGVFLSYFSDLDFVLGSFEFTVGAGHYTSKVCFRKREEWDFRECDIF